MSSECREAETLIPRYIMEKIPEYEGSNHMDGDMWTALSMYIIELESTVRELMRGETPTNDELLLNLGIKPPGM